MQQILLVDNDSDMIAWGEKHLARDSVAVLTAEDSETALKIVQEKKPDLILLEYHLKPKLGTELLKQIRLRDPNALVILHSNFPPTNAVIEAMKLGAFDFLRKQALPYELMAVVESALKSREEILDISTKQPLQLDLGDQVMIGVSPPMQNVFKMIGRVSRGDAAVTITGESGCGKEVVARAVHKFSPRTAREFVAINCAAIPENLLESELFGHEKGAFTGASTQRIGRFEQCDGGTLFLDEIGDMPMQLQSKILRVLQEGEFSRVGGNQTLRTDVRVLAATNKNLEKEVEQNRFREDLFYRLNVVRIHLPPLRERPDDIRPLANFFLQRLIAKKKGNQRLRFAEATLDVLSNYNWPGNVRELENTILRAVALANTEVLMPKDIPLGSNLDELPNPEAILAAGPTLTLAEIWAFAKANDPANPLQWLTTALKSHDRN
jgi:two-component system, NtrC family, nitrogen regulation response regulator GlnG